MLSIQSTELLTGVRISGDFWDLDELVTAIHHIVGDENRYYDYQGARLRILGVCFDIRHAAQGDRNIEFAGNGIHKGILVHHKIVAPEKNIYFSAEILWPELIFTAIALNDFIRLHQEMIDASEWNIHIATIRKFQATVAECLEQHLGAEEFLVFVQMLHAKNPLTFRYATQYIDVLNIEYLHLTVDERKEHLAAFALRIMLEDEEYVAFKAQLLDAVKTTKNALHEIQIDVGYPEEIIW